VVLQLAGVFGFLQMNHPLNTFAHPWLMLCVKKHCCQQSAFFATSVPSKVRKCAVPPEHLLREISSFETSEISTPALATFQNIGKSRKQEPI